MVRNSPKREGLEFIQEMSNTYRYTLTSKQQDLVTLKEEMEFLDAYTYLLKKRFGDNLVFDIQIPGDAGEMKIPPMAVQTLVENGIQHNIITKETPLKFKIYVENEMVCVENNLYKKENSEGFGSGLKNLANRFELIAGKSIDIEQNDSHFRVKLPLI